MKTLDKNLPKELRHVARRGLADEFLRTVGQHASKLVGKSLYQSLEDNGVHRSLIEELVTGRGGITRGAVVRTSKTGISGHISRSLQKLCPLEIQKHDSAIKPPKQTDLRVNGSDVPQGSVGEYRRKLIEKL